MIELQGREIINIFSKAINTSMALVLYQGGGTGGSGTTSSSIGHGRQDFSDQANTEAVADALETLTSKDRKKKYIGLAN